MRFERPARKPTQLPIVSLIDILFIVLIFFIVSSEFRKKRDVLKIELPTVREVPSEVVADDRSVLAVDRDGAVRLDDLTVPNLRLLEAYLRAYVKENPGRKLELEADKDVSLEQLVAVWDALTKVGIEVRDVPARIRLPGETKEGE
ncbi:MAG: biopolymer transporter ExbD [Akkermansiaceae bacterium]|jgi:biopolymer transport protein ExbD|nr:biopolymer transporter ExbD [Akkermansiaceae bacterium]